MKEGIKYLIVVLLVSIWSWTEYKEDIAHKAFFNDMREFTEAGQRFTSENGIELCMELNNKNELLHEGSMPINCNTLFEDK